MRSQETHSRILTSPEVQEAVRIFQQEYPGVSRQDIQTYTLSCRPPITVVMLPLSWPNGVSEFNTTFGGGIALIHPQANEELLHVIGSGWTIPLDPKSRNFQEELFEALTLKLEEPGSFQLFGMGQSEWRLSFPNPTTLRPSN